MLQVHCFRTDTSPSAAATNFISPINGQVFDATEHRGTVICAADGVFSNWSVILTSAPGVGKSLTFTLRKNQVDTSSVITISGTSTSGTATDAITLADGDELSIKCVPAGTPTVSQMSISWDFSSSNARQSIYGMGNANGPTAIARENRLFFAVDITNWVPTNAREIVPVAGTVKKYTVKLDTTPGVGTALTFVITKNGTDQDGTAGTPDTRLTFNNGDTKKSTTFSLILAEADVTTFKVTPTGAPGSIRPIFGVQYESTTDGESIFGANVATGFDTANTVYGRIGSGIGSTGISTVETDETVTVGITGFNLKRLRAAINLATAGGTSYNFRVRKNTKNTSMQCTISGPAGTTCSRTSGNIPLSSGDAFDVQVTPSGGPLARAGGWWFAQSQTGEPTPPPTVPPLSVPVVLVDLVNGTDFPFDGTAFSLPAHITRVTWQTSAQVAPASMQIDLQISLDGQNWSTVDTTSSTTGEVRVKRFCAQYVRANGVAASGGSGISAKLVAYKEKKL